MAIRFKPSAEERQILIAGLLDASVRPNTTAILRRVQKIKQLLDSMFDEIELDYDDFEFLRGRFKQAENWNIAPTDTETAEQRINKVTAVEDLLDDIYKDMS